MKPGGAASLTAQSKSEFDLLSKVVVFVHKSDIKDFVVLLPTTLYFTDYNLRHVKRSISTSSQSGSLNF